jgi:hypothetical protein
VGLVAQPDRSKILPPEGALLAGERCPTPRWQAFRRLNVPYSVPDMMIGHSQRLQLFFLSSYTPPSLKSNIKTFYSARPLGPGASI